MPNIRLCCRDEAFSFFYHHHVCPSDPLYLLCPPVLQSTTGGGKGSSIPRLWSQLLPELLSGTKQPIRTPYSLYTQIIIGRVIAHLASRDAHVGRSKINNNKCSHTLRPYPRYNAVGHHHCQEKQYRHHRRPPSPSLAPESPLRCQPARPCHTRLMLPVPAHPFCTTTPAAGPRDGSNPTLTGRWWRCWIRCA